MLTPRYCGVLFPIEHPRVTLRFGATSYPYRTTKPHAGIDLAPYAGSTGAPIRAPLCGVVTIARATDPYVPGKSGGGYGKFCVLRCSLPFDVWASDVAGHVHTIHKNEDFHLVFAHFDRLDVTPGQRVNAGQQLGTLGSSGYAFGPHLHLELRKGPYEAFGVLDPMDLFAASIVGIKDEVEYAA